MIDKSSIIKKKLNFYKSDLTNVVSRFLAKPSQNFYISTQPEFVNIQFLDRVRRTNIFTYSTVTDPLPGDLIIEDIDLEQKMCQIFHFEAKNWDKNLGFSQFLSHSIDYPNYRMRQNWGKPEILPEFLTGFRVTLSWHVLAACKMHSRVKVVSLIKCYLWLNIW